VFKTSADMISSKHPGDRTSSVF